MGLLEQIAEEARALAAAGAAGKLGRDDRYWKSLAYAFRISGPAGDATFPLVLNPKLYKKTHPFSSEIQATQQGGVYIEEAGVIVSEITLQGNTGFAPMLNAGDTGVPLAIVPLSGQAHFMRLQDLCFLRYGELKNDPEIGPLTRMTFHNFQDNEHWVVAPKNFELNRTVEDRVLYPYSITLDVLGAAAAIAPPPSEDAFVLATIADSDAQLQLGHVVLAATLLDLQGIRSGLGSVVEEALTAVDDVAQEVRSFVVGTKKLIELPHASIVATQVKLSAAIDALSEVANLPADVVQIMRDTEDALDVIGTYPEKFTEPFDVAGQRFMDLTQGPASSSTDALDAAAASTATQPQQLASGALRTGDKSRVDAGLYQKRTFPRYAGFREIEVSLNDTLAKIAARELGDARRWVDLAIANQLKPPYISESGLPDTKRAGDMLLIPTKTRATSVDAVRSSGDPEIRASQSEAIYGRDLALVAVGSQFDVAVDTAGGATDVKTVAGVDNVKQACTFILNTERGEDLLFTNVGFERVIGRRGTFERVIAAELSIVDSLQRDPRVKAVKGVNVQLVEDVLEPEIDIQLVDNNQLRVIPRVVR